MGAKIVQIEFYVYIQDDKSLVQIGDFIKSFQYYCMMSTFYPIVFMENGDLYQSLNLCKFANQLE